MKQTCRSRQLLRLMTFFLTLFMIVPVFTACQTGPKDTDLRTLIDQTGRTVVLPEAPCARVVSCYYVTTYAMLALGAGDLLVGIEKKAESRPIYAMAQPALLELEQVGSMKECNMEAIAELEPDLVLMPKKLMEYADALTELGIPVLMVDPESDAGLREMLTLLGKACGKEDAAEALIEYYDEKQTMLAEITAPIDFEPRVCICGNSSYLTVAPAGMYQSTLIEQAGGKNAAGDLDGDYWTEISYETFLVMNPDVIILPSDAGYTAEDVLSDPELTALHAVKNGYVYQMPHAFEAWDSPIPSGILGAMWLCHTLHSDAYPIETFRQDVRGFYETFYGFTPDSALLDAFR